MIKRPDEIKRINKKSILILLTACLCFLVQLFIMIFDFIFPMNELYGIFNIIFITLISGSFLFEEIFIIVSLKTETNSKYTNVKQKLNANNLIFIEKINYKNIDLYKTLINIENFDYTYKLDDISYNEGYIEVKDDKNNLDQNINEYYIGNEKPYLILKIDEAILKDFEGKDLVLLNKGTKTYQIFFDNKNLEYKQLLNIINKNKNLISIVETNDAILKLLLVDLLKINKNNILLNNVLEWQRPLI
ncbi:hypothetical protein FJO69_01425 [[Mycoplasma] falconis]|uniref:Uncharacterized protein n=1 Tax=[Mycoplasma] falconis TaxID=92403 RepID=A0A501XAG8_9BACT|nr:hypothetical protein [[Mycoplasma] falconis]TPE57575.1 hypothetical protein FJO69_01425 [[Mycoplasma] falconis]